MYPNCRKVLPYIGLELGNPSVIFIDPAGTRVTHARRGMGEAEGGK
jgi:hypothetical protein